MSEHKFTEDQLGQWSEAYRLTVTMFRAETKEKRDMAIFHPEASQQDIYNKYQQLVITTSSPYCPVHAQCYSDDAYDFCKCETSVKYEYHQIYDAARTLFTLLRKNVLVKAKEREKKEINRIFLTIFTSIKAGPIAQIMMSYLCK